MEPRFGRDFSQVRVHADADAAESARSMGVLAYTVGRDVVFGAGRYAPGTVVGDRLLAHELAHVVQQECPAGAGRADPEAERRARAAADTAVRGGSVPPELVGRTCLGIAADDGRDSLGSAGGPPTTVAGRSLVGRLQISAQLVEDLRKKGLLSPELAALIDSGQIVMEPEHTGAPPVGSWAGTGSLAGDLNAIPRRFGLLGPQASPGTGFGSSVAAPLPRSLLVGGYKDPALGYVAPQNVKYSQLLQPKENWLTKLIPNLKATFGMFDGVTISNLSRPGVSTNIFVTGITQTLGRTKGGIAGQVELGWDRTLGFQLSRAGWSVHGEVDPSGQWSFSLSFPGEAPLPVLPWVDGIFREGAVAIQGLSGIASRGVPSLENIGPLVNEMKPNIDRLKNAVDAGKGIANAKPGWNLALTVGSGPRPGETLAEKPSAFYLGGTIVGSF